MAPLGNLNGTEWIEVISVRNGIRDNYRFRVADLISGITPEPGADGKSAYEIAVENGFVGTEQQWLESLKGEQGEQGADGYQGVDGKSAYELAVEQGFEGTEQEWLSSLVGVNGLDGVDGASAYQIAVQLGFEGTEEQWIESLHGVPGENGKSAYEIALEHGYEGTEEEFYEDLMKPDTPAGAVFITNIQPVSPSDNVGDIVYDEDGSSILTVNSTTNNVRVTVRAMTGYSRFRPNVVVNGEEVELTIQGTGPLFTGTVILEVDENGLIRAEHEDGAYWESTLVFDTPPAVVSGSFIDPYPAGQTELKEDDEVTIQVTTDMDVVAYEIRNEGALKASSGSMAPTSSFTVSNRRIANRGNSTNSYGFSVRVQKASGAWSPWFTTQETVDLNNLHPTITFGVISYPAGQTALKGNEEALVTNTVTNFDIVEYTSTQLSVVNPDQYENVKSVTRVSGGYNNNTNNLQIRATRSANGAVSESGAVVRIANDAPVISVTLPAPRLRSGGNNGTSVQSHLITITSTQALTQAPSMNAPEGTWESAAWSGNAAGTVWTRRLNVHDDDAKGVFNFNSLNVVSRSGVVQNTINSGQTYTLGGFVFRTLTVPAFPNREASIGTHVVNTSKLRCTNLGKGSSGSLNFTYKSTIENEVDRYTITSPSGVANPEGDIWYNNDLANASSNSTGTMRIELEEVV